jgi:hypothetical protein
MFAPRSIYNDWVELNKKSKKEVDSRLKCLDCLKTSIIPMANNTAPQYTFLAEMEASFSLPFNDPNLIPYFTSLMGGAQSRVSGYMQSLAIDPVASLLKTEDGFNHFKSRPISKRDKIGRLFLNIDPVKGKYAGVVVAIPYNLSQVARTWRKLEYQPSNFFTWPFFDGVIGAAVREQGAHGLDKTDVVISDADTLKKLQTQLASMDTGSRIFKTRYGFWTPVCHVQEYAVVSNPSSGRVMYTPMHADGISFAEACTERAKPFKRSREEVERVVDIQDELGNKVPSISTNKEELIVPDGVTPTLVGVTPGLPTINEDDRLSLILEASKLTDVSNANSGAASSSAELDSTCMECKKQKTRADFVPFIINDTSPFAV